MPSPLISNRSELLRVRLSPEERHVIRARAEQCREGRSTFVREVALGSVPRERPYSLDDTRRPHEVLDNLLQAIRAISTWIGPHGLSLSHHRAYGSVHGGSEGSAEPASRLSVAGSLRSPSPEVVAPSAAGTLLTGSAPLNSHLPNGWAYRSQKVLTLSSIPERSGI